MTPILAHGNPVDYFWMLAGSALFIAAFCAALTAVVWFVCRVVRAAGEKPDRKEGEPE